MTIPTISSLPEVPATNDPDFETKAPTLLNAIRDDFVPEMNAAIAAINSLTGFGATVSFVATGDSPVTGVAETIYMCDTTGGTITITLPSSPSQGARIIVIDQKGTFGTNAVTLGRNGNNINGVAADVTLELEGMRTEIIYNTSYGWTAIAG